MQEWIIAMLVVSILLMIRDMAKTVFSGKTQEKEEIMPLCESHPQKEKVEKYAASLRKLADTFYGMPYRKEFLSSRQLEPDHLRIPVQQCVPDAIRGKSAGESVPADTMRCSENMIRTMESGNEETIRQSTQRLDWSMRKFRQYFQVDCRISGRKAESCMG